MYLIADDLDVAYGALTYNAITDYDGADWRDGDADWSAYERCEWRDDDGTVAPAQPAGADEEGGEE